MLPVVYCRIFFCMWSVSTGCCKESRSHFLQISKIIRMDQLLAEERSCQTIHFSSLVFGLQLDWILTMVTDFATDWRGWGGGFSFAILSKTGYFGNWKKNGFSRLRSIAFFDFAKMRCKSLTHYKEVRQNIFQYVLWNSIFNFVKGTRNKACWN